MKILARGAEAILLKQGNNLVKHRIKKGYRLSVLDEKLRKQRTKKEAKLLEKASFLINVPRVIESDDKEKIKMQFIEGKKLSEWLDKLENAEQVCEELGKQIAILHNNDIIHGDLTTSNIILVENSENHAPNPILIKKSALQNFKKNIKLIDKKENNISSASEHLSSEKSEIGFKVYFIDFGLGFHSTRIEDKAVDLHLLRQALEAKHFLYWKPLFDSVIKGYNSKDKDKVLEQLKKVEARGRYKKGF